MCGKCRHGSSHIVGAAATLTLPTGEGVGLSGQQETELQRVLAKPVTTPEQATEAAKAIQRIMGWADDRTWVVY